jgi:GntR family transcriptional regulator/MocR family aminotransferase
VTESWATFGSDLHLELGGARVRVGLERALRDAIRGRRLRPGSRLPSSRQLAQDLGLARNTVADAYGQLVAEGWLTSRHGSGTWVASQPVAAPVRRPPAVPSPRPVAFDLRAGQPDLSAFPRSAWLAAARRALGAAPNEALGYGDPLGPVQLRVALAEYLGRVRGVLAAPDRIVVCPGFTQALALLCHVLRARGGRRVVTEAYGYELHRGVIEAHGLTVETVDVDERGALVGTVADGVLLTPAHQFPIGVSLDPARRHRVVESGALVIEDDYDGEFRYDRSAVGAMQALASEQVVYAGTASKSLVPGIRLAWLVLPAGLVDDVVEAKRASGRLPSALDALTLAEFIASGGYDRQVRRARLDYRRRRDQLVEVIGRAAPDVRITGIAAGLHALLELPPGTDEDAVVRRAGERGLAVEGLRTYTAPGHRRGPALVVGYATPPPHLFPAALTELARAVSGSVRGRPRSREAG